MSIFFFPFSGKDTDSSALEEEGDDLKAMEAKIRCLGMKKKPSQGDESCFHTFALSSAFQNYTMIAQIGSRSLSHSGVFFSKVEEASSTVYFTLLLVPLNARFI